MDTDNLAAASRSSPARLRELAESAARLGGVRAWESFGRPQRVTIKSDHSEVTEVDLAVEQAIVTHIRAARPNDTFIGEEATDTQHPPRTANPQSSIVDRQSICWVIDPIDGTRNYIRGIPIFTCSVAALRDGVPVAAAVYDPVQDVMYSAHLGGGATANGRSLPCVGNELVRLHGPRAKLHVGVPSARRPATRRFVLHAVEQHVVRNFGSAALHLALVAAGRLDVMVVGNCRLWDIAAGCLLVTEAGGVVTSPDGQRLFPLNVSADHDREIPLVAGNAEAYARFVQEVTGQ